MDRSVLVRTFLSLADCATSKIKDTIAPFSYFNIFDAETVDNHSVANIIVHN